MPEHNEKNVERLAKEVTEAHDMDALIEHFHSSQVEYYWNDKEAFETDWKDMEIEDDSNL